MFWNIYSIINNLILEKNIRNANRPKSIRVCQKGNSHSFHYQIKLLWQHFTRIFKSFLSNPASFAFVFSVSLGINSIYTFLKTAGKKNPKTKQKTEHEKYFRSISSVDLSLNYVCFLINVRKAYTGITFLCAKMHYLSCSFKNTYFRKKINQVMQLYQAQNSEGSQNSVFIS